MSVVSSATAREPIDATVTPATSPSYRACCERHRGAHHREESSCNPKAALREQAALSASCAACDIKRVSANHAHMRSQTTHSSSSCERNASRSSRSVSRPLTTEHVTARVDSTHSPSAPSRPLKCSPTACLDLKRQHASVTTKALSHNGCHEHY